jgi:hypothetical protein
MKRLAGLLALLACLAVPATASAKAPIDGLQVCGPDGCADVAFQTSDGRWLTHLGERAQTPPAGRYHELRMMSGPDSATVYVLPAKGLMAVLTSGGDWFRLPVQLAERIRLAADRVAPFTFRLSTVEVADRHVADPSLYLPLLTQPPGRIPAADAYPHIRRWISIELTSEHDSPWTWGTVTVHYDPVLHAVSPARSFTWTKVPPALADRIEADAGIASPSGKAERSSFWPWAVLALAAAAILLIVHEKRGSGPSFSSVRRQHRREQTRPPG